MPNKSNLIEIAEDDDLAITGTTGEAIAQGLRDQESTYDYLIAHFLVRAMQALTQARRDVEMSQGELADRLGTTQSAVARWERDTAGRISLANYCRFALALGKVPLDIVVENINVVQEYAIQLPLEARSEAKVNRWKQRPLSPADQSIATMDALPMSGFAFASTVDTGITLQLNQGDVLGTIGFEPKPLQIEEGYRSSRHTAHDYLPMEGQVTGITYTEKVIGANLDKTK